MNLDAIFNLHKVKFVKLDTLFRNVEVQGAIDSVNVFINIESIFAMFHNKYMEDRLLIMSHDETHDIFTNIIANVINLAAHYRLYFTKNKIRTNIVFYMNEHDRYSKLNNTIYNKKYREKYISDYTDNPHYETVNSIMKSALTGLDTIIDYIDSVYFVTSERIESSLLPYLIVKDKMLDGQFNLMVTKDPYDLQYVNKNFLVIYPSQDKSKILTKTNLWDLLRDEGDISSDVNLPSYLYSFMLSTIGDKRRGIGKIKGVGWNTIYKNILKLFKKFDIDMEDEIISFEQLAIAIKEDPAHPNNNRETVVNNYMSIDIDRQYMMLAPSQKSSIAQQLVDRFDDEALKEINNKMFDTTPINLMELNNYQKGRKTNPFGKMR